MMKTSFNLADDPVQGRLTQSILLQNALAGKVTSNQDRVKSSRILLSLYAQHIIADDHNKTTKQCVYLFNDVTWMQIRRLSFVDLELAERVLYDTFDVTRGV